MSVRTTGIVTSGITFYLDAYNTKSYVSGNTTTNDLVGGWSGDLINGVGYEDKGFVFDGVSDRIDFGNVVDFTGNFTLNFWTYKDDRVYKYLMDVGSNQGTLSFGPGTGSGAGVGMSMYCASGGGYLLNLEGELGTEWYPLNEWFNIAVVRKATTIELFLNGEEVFDASHTSTKYGGYGLVYTFGRYGGGSGYDYGGGLSTMIIYDRDITSTEVKQNYEATKHRFI
jgi:hypothetical protein